jgi:TIR domain-containing protein
MISLFFSYSHRDESLRNELETHLSVLKRQGVLQTWHDRRITAGSEIDSSINENLENAQIILLLVSAYFLDSNYCYDIEMARAMEKHREGTTRVIPVILHPCDWQNAPFGGLRATPTDGKAVSLFANQHEAFAIITKDIRTATSQFSPQAAPSAARSPSDVERAAVVPGIRSSNLRVKRSFSDHEHDQFREDSLEYMARYFEGSLAELAARNPHIQTRFRRIDAHSFTAAVYADGHRAAQCTIWMGRRHAFGESNVVYSNLEHAPGSSFNEAMHLIDDGYVLALKPIGMPLLGNRRDEALSQQGAAEYYWSLFIEPLQR